MVARTAAIVSAGSWAAGSGRSATEAAARPGVSRAEQQLAVVGRAQRAVGLDDGAEQAGGEQGPLEPGVAGVGQVAGEVDATPQRLARALRGEPGRLRRLRIPFGRQVFALGPQRLFPLASIVLVKVEAGASGFDRSPRGAGRLVGRFVQADERAAVLARERLGIEDQRANGGVRRPGDLADQVTGLFVVRPGPPGLSQYHGRGVPFSRLFGGRAGVLVARRS